jgi:hypothetical protein
MRVSNLPAKYHGLFKGVNFMTPEVEGYYELGRGHWAELSTGRGMTGEPIYGVTVRPDFEGGSELFFSRSDAEGHIERLERLVGDGTDEASDS